MSGFREALLDPELLRASRLSPTAFTRQRTLTFPRLLALGDARAATLGVSVQRTRFQGLMLAVAMTATGVAVCGPISFIGLVVPHMVRRIAGGRHRWLMPVSALTGALLLVIADLLARIIHPPLELPAGVLTAIIGAPWFVWLLVRMR